MSSGPVQSDVLVRPGEPSPPAALFQLAGTDADGKPLYLTQYCLECGYTLAGLPADGRCPECGHEYHPTRDVIIRANTDADRHPLLGGSKGSQRGLLVIFVLLGAWTVYKSVSVGTVFHIGLLGYLLFGLIIGFFMLFRSESTSARSTFIRISERGIGQSTHLPHFFSGGWGGTLLLVIEFAAIQTIVATIVAGGRKTQLVGALIGGACAGLFNAMCRPSYIDPGTDARPPLVSWDRVSEIYFTGKPGRVVMNIRGTTWVAPFNLTSQLPHTVQELQPLISLLGAYKPVRLSKALQAELALLR